MHSRAHRWWFLPLLLLVASVSGGDAVRSAQEGRDPGLEETLPPPANRTVDFQTDIKPILDSTCINCHGPEKQKSGLRLDTKEGAMAGGDLGEAIIPGASADSYLIHKVTGAFDESIMPPTGDPLTDEQVGLLRAWIDQGAVWTADTETEAERSSDHWAFQPIDRPEPPEVENEAWVRNPIDAFVLARLERDGIAPSPEADRETLIRRLHFDLVGLPPTPEEVDAFANDPSPKAYEALVDRLLASPHFGERWGRHWLDLARYADSDGYEKDRPRPYAYRYRDWVIDAINRDLPFDQFTVEQLAGDLLPDASIAQKTAAGFHRNTLTNTEGGVDQEEYRVAAVKDRVDTTGTVWLGLTVGCAQCHSHKYDPILQREYYSLFAFFNTSNEVDLPAPTPEELLAFGEKQAAYEAEHAKLKARVKTFIAEQLPDRLADWEATIDPSPVSWSPLTIVEATSARGASLSTQPDGAILVEGDRPETDSYTIVGETDLAGVTAIRLEVLPDDSLPSEGPGRADNGNFVLSEFQVRASMKYESDAGREVGLVNPSADHSQQDFDVAGAIDGDPKTGWAIGPEAGSSHVAVFETDLNIGTDCGSRFSITIDQQHGDRHTIGKLRLSVTDAPRPVKAEGIPDDVVEILAIDPESRTVEQTGRLIAYYRTIDPELAKLDQAVAEHARTAPKPPKSKVRTLAEQAPGDRRETHMMIRGDFLRPGDTVEPGVPAVLHELTFEGERPTRLDLAHWLMDTDNPLTGRVAVNRIWHHLFGRALVTTMEDFGTRGDRPSHPDLLDWLASEYRRLGWRRKAMIETIVLSSTYRQSSATRPDLIDRDPANALLARQNRVRLEAEVIRDTALAASGLLSRKIGGPSVYPPQPKGIADLTYAGSANWPESTGADRYRRGLYTFFRRTSPYPMLTTFDAPDATVCTVERSTSNSPLQALTLLNNEVFVECARALGHRVMADAFCDCPEDRVTLAFRLCLGRAPSPEEREILLNLYFDFLTGYASDPDAAATLLGGEPPQETPLPEAAALVATARTIMNLDEFITRE